MSSPNAGIVTFRCVCQRPDRSSSERTTLVSNSRDTQQYGSVEVPPNSQPPKADYTVAISDDDRSSSSDDQHCHTGSEQKADVDKRARRKLLIATGLCVVFMLGEAIGGILANSLAVASDAAHLLTDFTSFIISLISLHIASKPATKRMSFGWYRAEVMGAIISVLMIWVVTAILVYMAVLRVIHQDFEIGGKIMLITSSCAVAFNIIMGVTLYDSHSHSHFGSSHSHGHDEPSVSLIEKSDERDENNGRIENGGEKAAGDKPSKGNINVRAAFIHVIGDFLQSLGVLIAAFIIYFKPTWKIVDPICTFLFSVLVMITTINILRETLHVLMEGTPRGIDFNSVRDRLQSIPGVVRLHNLRLWSLTVNKTAVAVHLAVDNNVSNTEGIVKQAAMLMRDEFDVIDCTIQIEQYVDAMQDCSHCQDPVD